MSTLLHWFLLIYFVSCSAIDFFKQDIGERFWFTSLNGSLSPPLPIDWPFLSIKSITQIVNTNPYNTDPALWILDGYSHTIYSSNSTKQWNKSLNPIQIDLSINQTKNIINYISHLVVFTSNNMNDAFYIVISSNYLLQLWYCSTPQKCNYLMEFQVSWMTVSSSAHITDFNAYLGTDDGLVNITIYNVNMNNPSNARLAFEFVFDDILLDQNSDNDILALTYNPNLNILAAGLTDRIYRFNLSSIISDNSINNNSYHYTWTFGLVDSYPTDMVFLYDDLYVANNACVNALRYMRFNNVDNIETWIRIGQHQQLPYDEILFASLGWDNSIWFVHDNINGAVSRFTPNTMNYNKNNTNTSIDGVWRYYTGNRYLTGNRITTMYGVPDLNMMFVATTDGLTVFHGNQTDLRTKADEIEEVNYPRHDRFGQIGDCGLNKYGNLSSWHAETNDNNGLWTSMYLSGLAMKYTLTKNNNTLSRVWHHTDALEMLHNVTGIKGLVARSFSKISDGYLGPTWINSTEMPGWQWKSDTSSDEICGHIYVYAVLYDVVAQTKEQKTFVLDLMISIIDYILDNNYQLIDYTGKRTTWGFWDPFSLNQVRSNFDERGLNSLQIMSWIMAAYYYTNLHINAYPEYANVYDTDNYLQNWLYLGNEHGYFANIINTKITIPDDINHSDDELAGLSYMVFMWVRYQYNNNKNILNGNVNDNWNEYIESKYPYFDISWNRQYKYVSGPYLSWYSSIQLIHQINTNNNDYNTDLLKEYIIQDLQRWPMEWITWPIVNSDRIDVILDWTMGRSCGDITNPTCARTAFPHDQSNQGRWNSNPFECDGGNGYSEQDTGAFTMSYWLAKYFNFI